MKRAKLVEALMWLLVGVPLVGCVIAASWKLFWLTVL